MISINRYDIFMIYIFALNTIVNLCIVIFSRLRVTGISRTLIWSKTLMELIFNSCGGFRWSPEDSVNQIHSPHLQFGDSGIFSDHLKSVHMLKREWGTGSNGKLPHLFNPGKTAALVPEFAIEDLPSAELQPRLLRLQRRTCPWTEHTDFMFIRSSILVLEWTWTVLLRKKWGGKNN